MENKIEFQLKKMAPVKNKELLLRIQNYFNER